MNVQLLINNGSELIEPAVQEGIVWETERKGVPGKLTFNVLKDSKTFEEGNPVRLTVGKSKVFYGFVFTKKYDKNELISVTAYDQLRYFKNKDTYVYKNKTATELLKMLAGDFNLNLGSLDDTGYKIESRIEDNKSLFDIMQTALDLTLKNRKQMYVLYDDFGKLMLKNLDSMKLDVLVDDETAENYNFISTIDSETYNKVKLSFNNSATGKRDIYIAQDSRNMNSWGVLQYFDTLKENENGKIKADALLELYNKKTRNLSITGAFGDVRVRGGSLIPVILELEDVKVQNYMLVERAKHVFNDSEHIMDLTLRGGGFDA